MDRPNVLLIMTDEERHNRVADAADALRQMKSVLDARRDEKRLLSSLRPGAA